MSKLILETCEKLNEFRNKAGVWQTEQKAFSILTELKKMLLQKEYNELAISFSHYRLGEGREELDIVCKELISKYRK